MEATKNAPSTVKSYHTFRNSMFEQIKKDKLKWMLIVDLSNLVSLNNEISDKSRKLPTRRMHMLLSIPPTKEEISILQHIDLE